VVVLVAVGSAGSVAFLRFGASLAVRLGTNATQARDLGLAGHPTLLADDQSNPFDVMKTLFWNRGIVHVAVLGTSSELGRAPTIPARLVGGDVVESAGGTRLRGPFAVDPYTTWTASHVVLGREREPFERATVPPVTVFGLAADSGDLEVVSRLVGWAGARPRVVTLRVRSASGAARLAVSCPQTRETVRIPAGRPVDVTVPILARSVVTCRLSFVGGQVFVRQGVTFGVRVTSLSVRDRRVPS
jgi:hypothetical protein